MPVALRRLTTVFQDFGAETRPSSPRSPAQITARGRLIGAVALLAGALMGLICANSPASEVCNSLRHMPIAIGLPGFSIQSNLRLFINEFLGSLFFMTAALSVKREYSGRDRQGSLPFFPAIAAAAVAMTLLALATGSLFGPRGWLIGAGTDFGFLAAGLALAGAGAEAVRRYAVSFAAAGEAAAIVALVGFGATSLVPDRLFLTAVMGLLYAGAWRLRWLRGPALVVTGIMFWSAWASAGLPAAVAGVFLALFASARPEADERVTAEAAEALLDRYDDAGDDADEDRRSSLAVGLSAVARRAEPELDRWQRRLLPWVGLLVMPLFGWANAGVKLERASLGAVAATAAVCVLAFCLARPAGFLGATWWLARRGRGGALDEIPVRDVAGLSLMSGAGGVMAAYTAMRVLPAGTVREAAVATILLTSAAAALAGAALLRRRPGTFAAG